SSHVPFNFSRQGRLLSVPGCKITDSIRSLLMSKRIAAFFVLALLISLNYIQVRAQSGTQPKRFVIWDERGKFGYMDETGRVVIKPQFDRAFPFTEGLAAVSIGNKAGFIDTSGKVVVPLQYFTAYPFSDGVAAVSIIEGTGNNRRHPCGYVDHAHHFIIQLQKKFSCTEFQEGFAVVEEYDSSLGESYATYMNKEGLTAVAGHLSVAKPFSEGLALIEDYTKWFLVNNEGQTVIDLRPNRVVQTSGDRYVPAGSFSEGLAQVGIIVDGTAGFSRFAYMNRKGQIVFKLPDNTRAEGDFHDGRAHVHVTQSKHVLIKIGRDTYDDIEDLSARGFIDKTGKLVIQARFSRVQDFSEGLAVVRVGHGLPIDDYNITPERWKEYADNEAKYYSCIDRSGRVVIEKCGEPLTYDELVQKFSFYGRAFGKGFVDGLYFNKIHAGRRTVYGYQDRTGKYVWIQPHGPDVAPPRVWRE
ncbi:MAG TPA: WG repeat-containing protein, partial [Pyrinomonadaceae bacterium]|nr:WG repeat-containing protein [Pyrinomonadaceae bacterium]